MEAIVTPFQVQGTIDYDKIEHQFGIQKISSELLSRFEKLTGFKPHRLLRRGIFTFHRDFDKILDTFEKGKQIFLYTGRGPSGTLHIGHYIPLEFTVYLQKAFNAIVVFQLADDEKFFSKDNTLDEIKELGKQNTIDIIAMGFDMSKTFIFSNNDYKSNLAFQRICDLLMKQIKIKDIMATFGLNIDCNVGQFVSTVYQIAASFSESFPHLFSEKNVNCLICCAIDQDPYFRIGRDIAPKLGLCKPALIESKFLVSMDQTSKMSTTGPTSNKTIFFTDSAKDIATKINKHAFSGGQDTTEKHREKGGNTEIDVAFQYLKHFLEDDELLEKIKNDYESGILFSGPLKKICIDTIQQLVKNHQIKRENIFNGHLSLESLTL